jgi:hypothetical protein
VLPRIRLVLFADPAQSIGRRRWSNVLLNPFKPLIDIVKNYKKYYDDLIEVVKTLAWKFVLVIGGVLGFMIGLPFWILIRAITPSRKAA